MIVQWFAEMAFKLLTGLLSWITLPSIPDDILDTVNSFIEMIFENGIALVQFFIPSVLASVGIPIVLIILAFKYGYFLIMWILKKIPVAGIN